MALIPLRGKRGAGKFAIVDDDVVEDVGLRKWCVDGCGYPLSRNFPRAAHMRMHRYVWCLRHEIPEGFMLDHRNRDVLDNRLCNLRLATHSQNECNKARVSTITGFKGVSRNHQRFRVLVKVDGKAKHFGNFVSAREAAMRYDEIVRELYGDFACTNADMGLV